jgi:hypothetical protein
MAGISEMCSPHTIVVNRAGHRFADEVLASEVEYRSFRDVQRALRSRVRQASG